MSKLTVTNRYGTTPNEILNHPEMTMGGKGLWGYIQSKPPNWKFSVAKICSQTKEGKAAVNTLVKELESFGTLTRIKSKNNKGQWDIEYILKMLPENHSRLPVTGEATTAEPVNNSKKDNSKKEIVKSNPLGDESPLVESGNIEEKPPIADFIEAMRPLNDVTCDMWFRNSTQREYTGLLRKKYTLKQVKYFADLCKLNRGVQLFKNITTPKQLAEGIPSIEKFFLTNGHKGKPDAKAGRGVTM